MRARFTQTAPSTRGSPRLCDSPAGVERCVLPVERYTSDVQDAAAGPSKERLPDARYLAELCNKNIRKMRQDQQTWYEHVFD